MKAKEHFRNKPFLREVDIQSPGQPDRHFTGKSRHDTLLDSAVAVSYIDRLLTQKLLELLGYPPINISLWDLVDVPPVVDDPVACIHFKDRAALYQTLQNPELHWGDFYSEGRVDVDGDLAGFLEVIYRGMQRKRGRSLLRSLNDSLQYRKISNTLNRAADNIHHHYDIGNDFYRLWLDKKAMQYTCAYYPYPDMGLEEAQLAKIRHVCNKLQIKAGDRVVEAGCGWGGFSLYLAKHHDVKVKAYNISSEQVKYARAEAKTQGLEDRVEYVHDDYRNISGKYDIFVSVGMLEHVGPRHYPTLGNIIDSCLKPGGRGLIHSIGRNRPKPINAWIERRIFPGAYPPTLLEMMEIFEAGRLSVLDVENLRMHYVLTLDAWLRRFEQHADQVGQMMDERFVRAWRLYLTGSMMAFSTGNLQLFQIMFTREDNNDIPWSRAHLYSEEVGTGIDPRWDGAVRNPDNH